MWEGEMETKKLICGKCSELVVMEIRPYGKKRYEFSWWCLNCKDLISQEAVITPDYSQKNGGKNNGH